MNVALVNPSASLMPDVSAVSVSLTCAVPLMVGRPNARVFEGAAVSLATASSLKDSASRPWMSLRTALPVVLV